MMGGVQDIVAPKKQLARTLIAALAPPESTEEILGDLRRGGFSPNDVALIATDVALTPRSAAVGFHLEQFGQRQAFSCRGLGNVMIVGGALPQIDMLEGTVSFCALTMVLINAGLSDTDVLIYELGLIRGQCLILVAAALDNAQVAYRLMLRHSELEVHSYPS